MLKNENIIIFSSDDWKSGLKSSKYHIAVGFAKLNKVLFVNSVGLRTPNLSSRKDLRRMFGKLIGFLKGVEKVDKNLLVFTPLIIPLPDKWPIKIINYLLLILYLQILKLLLNISKPIVFIFSPNFYKVAGKLGEKRTVYYCIDDLGSYKGVNKKVFFENEFSLLKRADSVIVCSEKLLESKKKINNNTFYVPHGVDWTNFHKTLSDNFDMPEDIKHIQKPIIGYYGFISEDWIDYELIDYIGLSNQNWSVVLLGRAKEDLKNKFNAKNIHFLGIKDFLDLPMYNKAFDVAIIPFKLNALTLSSNPLKLYEYLASGLPVVSVDIPEIRKFSSLISIATDKEDFVKKIVLELSKDSLAIRRLRSDLMQSNDWTKRLETISQIVTKSH